MREAKVTPHSLRVADFFCGGGGFSEGFRQAGFSIVFAIDKWAPAVETYRGNKPDATVVQDDILRISKLPDAEFEKLIPDTEVIIGSPPCQSFSHSNKSGNADKSLGIKLIEAYFRIIARKKFKAGSVLRYWVLENVPAVKEYIREEYTAADLELEGDFVLRPRYGASGKYNAKYFGAPTNRERYLCGEFPKPIETRSDKDLITLGQILDSLGDPLRTDHATITDINYPDFTLDAQDITDQHYIYELADFECRTAKRLKQDKGYMGKMSFPENLDKPARTVMATMTASAREAMILGYGNQRFRLPTVREVACMMSFPLDYRFYGQSKGIKHTLVGNAVPPKMSYAIAVAIARREGMALPEKYLPIKHNDRLPFFNLNGRKFDVKKEKQKRETAKFKYHIPYLIIDAYRVELTNYHSDFEKRRYLWSAEIHYSQGKQKAQVYTPKIAINKIPIKYRHRVQEFIKQAEKTIPDMNKFQVVFRMTTEQRSQQQFDGPFDLLEKIKDFIDNTFALQDQSKRVSLKDGSQTIPLAIVAGYLILKKITTFMGRKS